MNDLPPGYVLDSPQAQGSNAPPSGYVINDFNDPHHQSFQQIGQGIKNDLNVVDKFVNTGAPEFLTGDKLQNTMFNATAQNIPDATQRPFDSNVEAARNPINQFGQVANQGLASTAGQIADNATSLSGLALGLVSGLIKNSSKSAVEAIKNTEPIQAMIGKKFDIVGEGQKGIDAFETYGSKLGKDVSAKYMNPMGDIPVDAQDFTKITQSEKLPPPLQRAFQRAIDDGKFDMVPGSKNEVMPNVRNAHEARMVFSKAAGERAFTEGEGSTQFRDDALHASNRLGQLIDNTTNHAVRAVNGPYSNFMKISTPLESILKLPDGAPAVNKTLSFLTRGEPAHLQYLHELRQQIPELDSYISALEGKALKAQAIKGAKGIAGEAAKGVGLANIFKGVGGNAAEAGVEGGL